MSATHLTDEDLAVLAAFSIALSRIVEASTLADPIGMASAVTLVAIGELAGALLADIAPRDTRHDGATMPTRTTRHERRGRAAPFADPAARPGKRQSRRRAGRRRWRRWRIGARMTIPRAVGRSSIMQKVAGYTEQSDQSVALVNYNKEVEESVLRMLDSMMNRAVFQPVRVRIATGISVAPDAASPVSAGG